MLVRSVLLVLFVFFSSHKWSDQLSSGQPYYCDSNAKIEEIKQMDIKRLLYSYTSNTIYLILADKIIYFRSPKITRKSNKDGLYGLVTSLAFYLPQQEIVGRKVLGHFYQVDDFDAETNKAKSQIVYEMYLDKQVNGSSKFTGKARKLKFDPIPGEREAADSQPQELHPFWQEVEPQNYEGCWANAVRYGSESIYLSSAYCNATSTPAGKMFLMWLRSFDPHQPVNISTFLISADNRLLISDQKINYQMYVKEIPGFQLNSFIMPPISFTEFLSCQTSVSEDREIKGWHYAANKFYVFLGRHYLIVDRQFVETGQDKPKQLQAYNLQFEDPGTRLEMLRSVWVKVFGPTTYLIPYHRYIFEIKLDKDNKVRPLSTIQQTSYIDYCAFNMLVVENNVYCFNGKPWRII